jgi:hypothetical protein
MLPNKPRSLSLSSKARNSLSSLDLVAMPCYGSQTACLEPWLHLTSFYEVCYMVGSCGFPVTIKLRVMETSSHVTQTGQCDEMIPDSGLDRCHPLHLAMSLSRVQLVY